MLIAIFFFSAERTPLDTGADTGIEAGIKSYIVPAGNAEVVGNVGDVVVLVLKRRPPSGPI